MYQRIAMLLSAAGCVVAVACSQSDPGITTAVKAKLVADDTVKAYQIDVDTADKVVTLSGTVETSAAKDQAVMIARGTTGVRDVVDQITVNPEAAPTAGNLGDEARDAAERATDRAGAALTDAALTTAVKSKLLADRMVSGLNIDVDTDAGVVTLSGKAQSQTEFDRAATLARETEGVKGVVNNITMAR